MAHWMDDVHPFADEPGETAATEAASVLPLLTFANTPGENDGDRFSRTSGESSCRRTKLVSVADLVNLLQRDGWIERLDLVWGTIRQRPFEVGDVCLRREGVDSYEAPVERHFRSG